MTNHFNRHIEGIDLDFWHDIIESRGELVFLNKGDSVCRFGQRTNKVGYVKSGYLIYTIDGFDRIGGFTFPGALFGDYPNCLHNLPARFDIVAGRKSEVWLMDATVLESLYDSDPTINHHGRQFAQAAYNSLIERYCSLLSGTPSERYQSLIARYPQLEQEVPQKEIAKYLQITPTHLSRIRKEMLGKTQL